jgi:hypothetical protein
MTTHGHAAPTHQVAIDWDSEEAATCLYDGELQPPLETQHGDQRVAEPAPSAAATAQPAPRTAGDDDDLEARATIRVTPAQVARALERAPATPPSSAPEHGVVRATLERAARVGAGARPWLRPSTSAGRRLLWGAAGLLVCVFAARWLTSTPVSPGLRITTSPLDARVTLDGRLLVGNTSPFVTHDLQPGKHELRVEKPGHIAQQRSVTLREGEHIHEVTVALAALPSHADLSVSSEPNGARILLDGQPTDKATPATLSALAVGRHVIALALDGHSATEEAVQLPEDARVSFVLTATSAQATNAGATTTGTTTRAEARAQARERRAAVRAAKVMLRYRARMGLPPDPVAQELVERYGAATGEEP